MADLKIPEKLRSGIRAEFNRLINLRDVGNHPLDNLETSADKPKPYKQLYTFDGKNIFVFRYDNPNAPNRSQNSIVSNNALVGNWFTDSLEALQTYIRMRQPGGNVVVIEVPKEGLEKLRASKHPLAKDMDIEGDNLIIPNDLLKDSKTFPINIPSDNTRHYRMSDMPMIRTFVNEIAIQLTTPSNKT